MPSSSPWRKAAPLLLLPLAPLLAVWLLTGFGEEEGGDEPLPEPPIGSERTPRDGVGGRLGPGSRPPSAPGTGPAPEQGSNGVRAPPADMAESVWGQVVAPGRRPVPGANVVARRLDPASGRLLRDEEPVAAARSDRDGSFRLSGLPSSPLVVSASADASGFAAAWEAVAGPGVELLLELRVGGSARVRVIRPGGEAVADGRVVYRRRTHTIEAATSPDGWAEFETLPLGPARFRAYDADGRFAEATAQLREGEQATIVCTLDAGWAIAGRVVDAATGAPLPDVEASVLELGTGEPAAQLGSTDADGRFSTSGVSASLEEVALVLAKEGWTPQRHELLRPEEGNPARELEIRLESATWVDGRVVDVRGRGAGGAAVWWVSHPAGRVEADATGSFRITLPHTPAPDALLVLAAHSPVSGVGTYAVRRTDATATPPTIHLTGSGTLYGRVVDDRGYERGGAGVRLEPHTAPLVGPDPPTPEATWSRAQALATVPHGVLLTTTAADGAFAVPGVPAGLYRLRVAHAGNEILWPELIEIRPGDEVPVEIVLPELLTIAGWVLTPQGDGVSGATLAAFSRAEPPVPRSLSGVSLQDGRFELGGASGDECWEVVARLAGHAPGRVACARAGDRAVEVRVGVAGSIVGTVRTSAGAPYTGPLRVRIVRRSPPASPGTRFVVGSAGPEAGPRAIEVRAGTFSLQPVAPGRYVIQGDVPDGGGSLRPEGVDVPATGAPATVDLTLAAATALEGVVRWKAGDAPVANARVLVDVAFADGSRAPVVATTTTDAMGRYAFARLAPATYRLRVQAPGAQLWEDRVDLRAGDETTTKDVSLLPLD